MGDSACWLGQICLECGRFVGSERAEADRCPHCDAELESAPLRRT